MRFVHRIPIYAAGVGFAALLLVVADARNWSDLTFSLAALGVALFYTAMILVPWLIHEQVGESRPRAGPKGVAYSVVVQPIDRSGTVVPHNGTNGASHVPKTHGPFTARHTQPHVTPL